MGRSREELFRANAPFDLPKMGICLTQAACVCEAKWGGRLAGGRR